MVTFYKIIKYITFPGAMVKGFLEHLFCRIFGIPIEYSDCMQPNQLCGHVEHMLSEKKGSFGFCWFPHIIMVLMGLMISMPAATELFYFGIFDPLSILFFYVGVSFLTNAFPLYEDSINMWEYLYGSESENTKTITKVLLWIPAAILYAGSWLDQYGATIFTALISGAILPFVVSLI